MKTIEEKKNTVKKYQQSNKYKNYRKYYYLTRIRKLIYSYLIDINELEKIDKYDLPSPSRIRNLFRMEYGEKIYNKILNHKP